MSISARMSRITALLLFGILWAMSAQAGEPRTPAAKPTKELKPKVMCSSMVGKTIPAAKIGLPTGGAKITSATLKPGTGPGGVPANFVPEYCEINGEIAPIDPKAPIIRFQVNIPTAWNQKAWQFGADGADGYIPQMVTTRVAAGAPLGNAMPPDLGYLVTQGYATYGGDAGHDGGPNAGEGAGPGGEGPGAGPAGAGQISYDMPAPVAGRGRGGRGAGAAAPPTDTWVTNDESFKNYAYEHIKKTHDAVMEVMVQMYGTRSRATYFTGESNGGKAALEAVGHYPQDYDGVLALVPMVYYTGLHMRRDQVAEMQHSTAGWVPSIKAAAIRNEVLRQCDALDGLADGVINNYMACIRLFDPTITPDPLAKIRCPGGADTGNDCLSDAQMATVNAYHAPMAVGFPLANGDTDFPGYPAGAEAPTQWLASLAPAREYTPASGGYMGTRVPTWDPSKLGTTANMAEIQAYSKITDVPEDWSGFFARKGKIIIYGGGADYQANVRAQMKFYDNLVKRFGQAAVDKSVRFYISPNVGHGSLGISATTGVKLPPHVDLVTVLENWAERDVAPPDPLIQSLKQPQPPYTIVRSKPLCRYPKYPRYNGSGDPEKAESYTCTAP